ncbi:hypothetical protein PHYSODRAFT_497705 [Phytophthora sojae]|uniref:DUF659 domain-containing protein n=1 Tax=Phytophthora sojae (strain P6497) TaxID=1094619 RepID=G4Z8I5_PHYSP|nr:hypothetical protein PHYSODRAFT_497705 [Phytophthora sojae]EGZ22536.1 hypothetical protein PHYSODRAFT_497705 [Phytophthora sojae]|eukprot:XP_009525253.1 hypothetical protein PHYSODRAFT_497705 [Phytophthora sojae]
MVTSPFIRPIFWSSERCADKQHTGEFMASELNKVIQAVENVVGKGSVCAVVTDNASNRRKSWELLMAKIPSLTCNGSAAHTINLLLKDMFGMEFMSDRRRALIIPVSTRWYSSTNCISSVVRNEDVLREAVMRLVNPIIQALGSLEKDGCCLSMVYEYFRGLKTHVIYNRETDDVASGVLNTIRGQISSRWNTLKRESILAAFLLDPTKSTDDFEGDDLDNAVDACVDLATRVGLPSNVPPNAVRRAVMAFIRVKKSWTAEGHEKNARDTPLD